MTIVVCLVFVMFKRVRERKKSIHSTYNTDVNTTGEIPTGLLLLMMTISCCISRAVVRVSLSDELMISFLQSAACNFIYSGEI